MKQAFKQMFAWVFWVASLGGLSVGHYLKDDGFISLGVTLITVWIVFSFLVSSIGLVSLILSYFMDKGEALKDIEIPSRVRILLGVTASLLAIIVIPYLGHTTLAIFYTLSTALSWVFLSSLLTMRRKEDNL